MNAHEALELLVNSLGRATRVPSGRMKMGAPGRDDGSVIELVLLQGEVPRGPRIRCSSWQLLGGLSGTAGLCVGWR
jgi:hypothetical protein